jgi:hypothetical protein
MTTVAGPTTALRTIDDLLAVEDDAALLERRCPKTGLLLWPLVRTAFLREIVGELLYGGARAPSGARRPDAMVRAVARASWHDLTHVPERADVLIMASGVGHQQRHGRAYNRLADPFVDAAPKQTLLVEDLFDWRWPTPSPGPRTLFHTPLQVAAAVAGRLAVSRRHRSLAEDVLGLVVGRARDQLGWSPAPGRREELVTMLARKTASLPFLQNAYRLLFERVRPRVLLKEEACYGPSAMLMSVAREMGIVTAEYQHGVVAAGHDAYNFAHTLRQAPAFRATLPEWFLGYGQWWNAQMNAPVRTRVIGNPYRSLLLDESGSSASTKRDEQEVLVLGDGIATAAYLDLARSLSRALPAWRVVFRPHPLERQDVIDRHPHGTTVDGGGRIELDVGSDIYTSFRRASVVVSEMSTGLFEAIGLVPSVLLWDTPKSRFTFREHPFSTFDSPESCAELLRDQQVRSITTEQAASIWAPDWKSNYLGFLTEQLGGSAPCSRTSGGPGNTT